MGSSVEKQQAWLPSYWWLNSSLVSIGVAFGLVGIYTLQNLYHLFLPADVSLTQGPHRAAGCRRPRKESRCLPSSEPILKNGLFVAFPLDIFFK